MAASVLSPNLLTVRQVAQRIGQSERSVRRKIRGGEIPAVRLGQGPHAPVRVDPDELERWIYGESP